jgi:hypothetical protein
MNADDMIKIIDTMKRSFLSLSVVGIAAYMTLNASTLTISDSNLGVWTGLAASVVMTYIGSKTVSQAISEK